MKGRKFKKLGGLLLSLLLVIAMLPTTAFAENNELAIDFDNLSEASFLEAEVISEFSGENDDRAELTEDVDLKDISEKEITMQDAPDIFLNPEDEETREVPPVSEDGELRTSRAVGNNDPNTALYLPSSYFGTLLANTATADEDWYCFDADADGKTSIAFAQEDDGQYAIILYELDSSADILNQVAYSAYAGTSQKLDYRLSEGTYYLRILPLTPPATAYDYLFAVYVSYSSDSSYEPNETYDTAYSFTDAIDVSGSIDNPSDVDWYKLTVMEETDFDVTATFSQENEYAVLRYDSDLNYQGGFYINNTTGSLVLDAGTHYLCVQSVSDYYSATEEYGLKMTKYVPTVVIPLKQYLYDYFDDGRTPKYHELATIQLEDGDDLEIELNCNPDNPPYNPNMGMTPESGAIIFMINVPRYDDSWQIMEEFVFFDGIKEYRTGYRWDLLTPSQGVPKANIKVVLMPLADIDLAVTLRHIK